ncbi:Crp/Fnr family transcriptional regulator [Candidatus Saccharibacteria bacterium]|nr:Crp/Fnr family transcriptional regulator [Candidatus Saccharibacteria bacterium]
MSILPTAISVEAGRRYPKGSIVLFQGEVPRYGFFVVAGSIKTYAIDNDGNERVVGFSSEGDIFPLDWLLGMSRSAMFYYETLIETQLVPIIKPSLAETIDADSEASLFVRDYLLRDAASGLLRNLALQQSNASNKILYLFYYLAIRHGKQVSAGLFNLGLPLTHQLIADNLGLTRETVAGEMSKFKKAGVVVYRRKQYVVDKLLLIKTVGKEITANFSN